MACSNCGSGGGLPKGCKNNGSCGTQGCTPYPVFDWLSNMRLPEGHTPFNILEIRFKNGRKEYFENASNLRISMGDALVVEGNPGFDIGVLSLQGELVRLQLKKHGFQTGTELPKILRKANQKDIDTWQQARSREHQTMVEAREIAQKHGLEMKISDVEFQGDGTKATFYYTAENRVDFRQLIRDFASSFHIRVEMKQIGARQEASRMGGIGSCGRELCCSSWLSDFRSVSTSAARYQQLSLNPQKLAGQCGKLKCCLNYELDGYLDALKGFPDTTKKLQTEKGSGIFMKMDIFSGYLWYAYKEDGINWHKLKAEDVAEILKKNKDNVKVPDLETFAVPETGPKENTRNDYLPEAVLVEDTQDDIKRFDGPKQQAGKNKNRRNKNQRKRPGKL